MPKMTSIQTLWRNAQPTLVIRTRASARELPRMIGENYAKLAAYLEEIGETLSDVPFLGMHNMDMEDLDLEFGFPVANPLPGKGEIQPGEIPAGKLLFCMYRGPYSEIGPVYEELSAYLEEHGLKAAGPVYEYYYNDPSFPESEYLTRIVLPLARD